MKKTSVNLPEGHQLCPCPGRTYLGSSAEEVRDEKPVVFLHTKSLPRKMQAKKRPRGLPVFFWICSVCAITSYVLSYLHICFFSPSLSTVYSDTWACSQCFFKDLHATFWAVVVLVLFEIKVTVRDSFNNSISDFPGTDPCTTCLSLPSDIFLSQDSVWNSWDVSQSCKSWVKLPTVISNHSLAAMKLIREQKLQKKKCLVGLLGDPQTNSDAALIICCPSRCSSHTSATHCEK